MGFDYFTESIAHKALCFIGLDNWVFVFFMKVILLSIGCYLWMAVVNVTINDERIERTLMF